MKKTSRSQEREAACMGSRVSQDTKVTTPCWTNSYSSHEVKSGNNESGDNGTGRKRQIAGSNLQALLVSSELG